MADYRTTIILKTDIVDSTPRLAGHTQAEMSLQRKQHRQFISQTAVKHQGAIFQEEGDAYWLEFPSVTNACLAAIEMHQSLRSQQAGRGEKNRVAIRAVITAGDILHEGSDSMGMTMSLTARLEKVTPADEIYLSHAAWLLLNKAEVQTSFVNELNLKGFAEAERVYKIEQKYKTRVLLDQYVVFLGVRGWVAFSRTNEIEVIEDFLSSHDDLINELCGKNAGLIRHAIGDEYLLTFTEAQPMLATIEELCRTWKTRLRRPHLGLSIAMHKGDMNILRSYLYGDSIVTTMFLQQLNTSLQSSSEEISVLASRKVRAEFKGTDQELRFQEVDLSQVRRQYVKDNAREFGAFMFIVGGVQES